MSAVRRSALLAILAVALAAPAAAAAAPAGGAQAEASRSSCRNGVVARIGGKRTCLAAGRRCQRRYQRHYRRNGYTCNRRDGEGQWRLRKTKQVF